MKLLLMGLRSIDFRLVGYWLSTRERPRKTATEVNASNDENFLQAASA